MVRQLPCSAKPAAGVVFYVTFRLHCETEDPINVHQLLSAILENIDTELSVIGPSSNGDVLQAVAMALAIRTRMINANRYQLTAIATDLVADSLAACMEAERQSPPAGHD